MTKSEANGIHHAGKRAVMVLDDLLSALDSGAIDPTTLRMQLRAAKDETERIVSMAEAEILSGTFGPRASL